MLDEALKTSRRARRRRSSSPQAAPQAAGPSPAGGHGTAGGWGLATLFPPEGGAPWGARGTIVAMVAAVAAGMAQLFRQSLIAPWNVMWAEDADPYLTDAWLLPFTESVPRTFHDYYHVYPRTVAELAVLPHPVWAAAIFAVVAALTAGVLAVTVYRASSGHIREPLLRALLAALLVLSPVAGAELMNNLANLQWYFCVAAFWVLLWRPGTALGRAWQVLVLALATLSAPITVVFIPLALLRIVACRRDARALAAPVVFLAGAAVQLSSMLRGGMPAAGVSFDPVLAVQTYAQRVALVGMIGDDNAGRLWEAAGWLGPVAAVFVLAGLVAVAVGRRSRVALPVLVAAATSVAFLAVAVSGRAGWEAIVWPPGGRDFLLGRYLLVPIALVHAGLVLTLDDRPRRVAPGTWRRGAAVAAALLVFGVGADYTAVNQRSHGPGWRAAVAQAARECRTIPGLDAADVEAAPAELDFAATIPCEELSAR